MTSSVPPASGPLADRNFRLLWVGETVSVLGDQFHLVALPWLALHLGGDGLTLGAVLMTAAVPRALFMLLGGALSDRLAPRGIMLASNLLRAVVAALLTVLVATDHATFVHLFVLAAVFGTVDAFYHPSLLAMVPSLVAKERLESANALVQGSQQAALLVGPALAGVLVASLGLAPAFGIDAATFFFTAATLFAMRVPRRGRSAGSEPVLAQIQSGLRYAFREPAMRVLLVGVALLNLALTGPTAVGLPMLADQRFGGAGAFGLMMSTFGGSMLVGAVLAGSLLRRLPLGRLTVASTLLFAASLATLGFVPGLVSALAALAVMGVGASVLNVRFIAWLQGSVEADFRGRVMSLVMFAAVGLAPLSLVGAGAVITYGFPPLFLGAALLMVTVTVLALATPQFRALGLAPTVDAGPAPTEAEA